MNYENNFDESLNNGKLGEKLIAEFFVNQFTDEKKQYSLVDNCQNKDFDLLFNRYDMRTNGKYDIFPSKKIKVEVKTDFYKSKTNNLFIETSSRNKKSGINSSLSDLFIYFFIKQDLYPTDNILIIKTEDLKHLIKSYKNNFITGGDNNSSRGVLLPLQDVKQYFKVFTYNNYKMSTIEQKQYVNESIIYIGNHPNKNINPLD